ncbi:ABC transporter [Chloroflexus islandicus]|uniref:ABC transporter n=1 Tax=Chloroflexus islandicus TaxID=1707952 RepID=A0A178LSX2_9CHLR|nr:ABC transporter permease [Chloroflexus islandicus]OAN37123.1 ABC transporter [Chloroflexus islandicus]
MRDLLANPVLTRELFGRIRGRNAWLILTGYLTIIGAITLLIYAVFANSASMNDPNTARSIGKAIFFTVMTAALVQVCFLSPSLTAGAIVGEKERQTYDLLLASLLSPVQIVTGKLVSAIAFALLLIMASLPIAGLALIFGGVTAQEVLIGVVGLLVTAVSYAAIGLFWSTVMRSTLGATVMAQGTVIAILLLVPFLFFVISLLIDAFDGQPTPLYVYTMGTFLCLHPFIALGITAGALETGGNPWLWEVPSSAGNLTVPGTWLVYSVIAVMIAVVCLWLAIRGVQPDEAAG